MRVLIVTGKFGMGHMAASLALRQELAAAFPSAAVEVEDFFAYALRGVSQAVYKCFDLLVTRGSGLYNAVYRLTENGRGDALPLYAYPLLERMEGLLAERRPDAVIATHPVCAQLVNRCKEAGTFRGAFFTCVTDVTAHAEWLCTGCDGYLVGAPQARDAFVAKGVDPARVLVTGIPVRREFKLAPRRPDGEGRRLLIMGGGLGLLPRHSTFYQELNALPQVKTTLITGNNRQLFHRLVGQYPNIQVLGFTPRVYDYMAASHLVLSKPGGVTLFEAISSRLPMLAWEPFLEQERRNANFMLQRGVGRVAPQAPGACLEAIRSLLFDTQALGEMSRRMEALQGELAQEGLEELLAALGAKGAVGCG